MKKIVFTLWTLVALVVMAGSANAQTNTTPFEGGTYSYTVTGIYSVTGATVSIAYVNGGTGANISNISATSIVAGATATNITFDVTYAVGATEGDLKVTVTEATCENFIQLHIIPTIAPTLSLSIASSTPTICQGINLSPADATPASDGVTNTDAFSFTITPTVSIGSGYSYVYSIALPKVVTILDNLTINYTGTGTFDSGTMTVTKTDDVTVDVFNVTYDTTTGIANQTVTGEISNATLTVTSGGADYTGSITTGSANVVVKTLPTIGGFN